MKNIFFRFILFLGLFACCKHYLPQPAEQPTPVAVDYYAPYLANITNYKKCTDYYLEDSHKTIRSAV